MVCCPDQARASTVTAARRMTPGRGRRPLPSTVVAAPTSTPSPSPSPTPSSRARVLATVAGIVVGVVAAVGLVAGGVLPRDGEPVDAVEPFLEAYRASREATYAMEGEFTRTLADGRTLSSAAFVAQRPPDVVRRQLGALDGAFRGRTLNCSTGPDGRFACAAGAPAPDYQAEVDRDVEILAGYFRGAVPLYEVTDAGDGCFDLRQVGSYPDPPYGVRTRMCFDRASGAMRLLELRREGGSVDRVEATTIRTAVVDADFSTTEDDEYAPDGLPPS